MRKVPGFGGGSMTQGMLAIERGTISERARIILEEFSDGKCSICDQGGKLVLDHDHETGAIRGLICAGCNKRLAKVDANKQVRLMDELTNRILDYVHSPPVVQLASHNKIFFTAAIKKDLKNHLFEYEGFDPIMRSVRQHTRNILAMPDYVSAEEWESSDRRFHEELSSLIKQRKAHYE